jgi:O-antigen/teichoic acid export membrane protein
MDRRVREAPEAGRLPNHALEHSLPGGVTADVGSRIVRAAFATSASQVVVVVLAFIASIAQARVLGADGRGDVARFVNAASLLVLYLGLGLSSAITYFVASGKAQPRALVRSLLPTLAATVIATGCVAGLAYVVGLGRFLPQSMPAVATILGLMAFFVASQVAAWASGLLTARMEFRAVNASALVVAVVGAGASIGLLAMGPDKVDARAVIALLIGLELVRAGTLLVALRNRSAPTATSPTVRADLPGLGPLWRYSSLSYMADAVQFLTYRVDMWIVDAARGGAELGRYALAVSLAQLVWIVPTALARVFFPYAASQDATATRWLARRAAVGSLAVSALAGAIGWVGSALFVTALFGDDFRDVPNLLAILLVGVVPYAVARVLGNYLAATGAVVDNVRASVAVLVVTIALDVALIPPFGAVGAAWASACSYLLFTIILVWMFLLKSRRGSASGSRA